MEDRYVYNTKNTCSLGGLDASVDERVNSREVVAHASNPRALSSRSAGSTGAGFRSYRETLPGGGVGKQQEKQQPSLKT